MCRRGTTDAASALAAEIVPVITPWIARSSASSSADRANPISRMMIAPPNIARSIIGLRPCRSASDPQIGDAIAIVSAWPANTMPAQNSRLVPVALPSSLT